MADQHEQTEAPSFRTFTGLIRRRWYALLLVLIVPAAALGFSLAQEEKYTAKTSVLFRDIDSASVIASQDPEREAATNVELVSLEAIKQRVEEKLGGGATIAGDVSVEQKGQSNVLTVDATDPNPQVAARTANTYAAEYVAFRRRAELQGVRDEQEFLRDEYRALPPFARGATDGRELQRRIRRLDFEAANAAGSARIISTAELPTSPSSPKPVRNALIGGVVGLFLAGIVALLFERLDPRLRTPKEAEAALDRPILALVRRSRALARAVKGSVPRTDFDDFLALRSYLRYMGPNGGIRSVLITSGSAGDGKTTVSWNLASAAAAPGMKVLLIEGDLRDPSLADSLGAAPEGGLADVLAGTATLEEVAQEVAVSSSDGAGAPRIVQVVFAGSASGEPTDPSGWERFGAELESWEHEYDLIVIDTPPLVSVPDAVPLLSHVGGVIVIGRLGSTPRATLARLREQLETFDAPTVGVVVNSVGKDAGYGYGYGQGG